MVHLHVPSQIRGPTTPSTESSCHTCVLQEFLSSPVIPRSGVRHTTPSNGAIHRSASSRCKRCVPDCTTSMGIRQSSRRRGFIGSGGRALQGLVSARTHPLQSYVIPSLCSDRCECRVSQEVSSSNSDVQSDLLLIRANRKQATGCTLAPPLSYQTSLGCAG